MLEFKNAVIAIPIKSWVALSPCHCERLDHRNKMKMVAKQSMTPELRSRRPFSPRVACRSSLAKAGEVRFQDMGNTGMSIQR